MFSIGDNLFGEFFRSSSTSSPASFQAVCAMLTLIPILIVFSSGPKVVLANQELTVYRMRQHDWLGNSYGSRSSIMNLEMRTLHTLSQSYAKKCLLIKLEEIIKSTETFENFVKNPMVGGMLVIIPSSFVRLAAETRSALMTFEKTLFSRTFDIPVYFVKENSELIYIHQELSKESTSDVKTNQISDLLNAISADGYQLSIAGPAPKPITDPIITNIESKLVGGKLEDQSSTIVIVAHYDASGIAPELSFGGDSNSSGAVALLELMRLFSKLYANRKNQPSVNLVFMLSGAGKFSFFGTKKWIEDHLDIKESGLLGDAQLSICLDSIGSSIDKSIYVHVPRIPKETSVAFKLFNQLSEIASIKSINASFIPKKTYLSEDLLNWEHDRFIQRRLPALTISSLQNSKVPSRSSIVDTVENVNIDVLTQNIEIIAEALYGLVFNNPIQSSSSIFKDELGVSKQFINSMLKQIANTPRSQQLLLTTATGSTYKVSPLISTLFGTMKKFSKDTRYHHFRMDRKEPEIVFYEPTSLATNIYNIKPAILDLFLSLAICTYLGALYLFLINFIPILSLVDIKEIFFRKGRKSTESRVNGSISSKTK